MRGPAGVLVICALAAAASFILDFGGSASADDPITWEKSPAVAQVVACDQTSGTCGAQPIDLGDGVWSGGIVLTEIMNNQGDPHGLGGYQLNVIYDPFVFQDAQIVDAGAINDNGLRVTSCSTAPVAPGNVGIQCGSTGPLGDGAVWSGSMVMAYVTLKLQPGVFNTIQSGPNGGILTTVMDSVRVTNTCGQPLNDGTIQPIPGQLECQGNLLAGLGANGTVLSAGRSTITITKPPATPTATQSPTATASATGTPTATQTRGTATTTRTAGTATVTHTPSTATVTHTPGTATVTRTPATVTVTRTPGAVTTAFGRSATPAPVTTSPPPATNTPPGSCSYNPKGWRDHPGEWPTDRLHIGHNDYGKDPLVAILNGNPSTDASVALAQQLIAAKLNAAAGRPAPPAADIAHGDRLLSDAGDLVPQHVSSANYRGQGMLWIAAGLAQREHGSDCGPASTGAVLGSTNQEVPTGLPSTGSRGSFGTNPEHWIITAMTIVIVSLLVVLMRQTFVDREPDE